ncbi:MAG: radical SAM protein [Actinomycetota bacterium]
MKVLLGHSYFQHFDPKLDEANRPYPPLGTLVAAALLQEHGHEVVVFDAMLARSTDGWRELLERETPDAAVLFEDNFNYLSKMCLSRMREAALEMLGDAAARSVFAVAAGSDASDNAAIYLEAGAAAVIAGEGDEALVDLLAARADGTDPAGLAGVSVPGPNGAVVAGPDRPNLKQLDEIPFAARDLVDVDAYRSIWLDHHGRFSLNAVTTRGCPYHCNWCSKPIWGQRYNARSADNVVAELVHLRDTFGPDHVWFADDIFGLKPGWIQRFAELVDAEDVRLPFKCLSRPDLLVRRDTAEALGAAGCEEVWIGAESGSQKILDAMEKGTTVEQIVEAADRVHASGYRIAFFIQFGYPGETESDIDKTLELIRRAKPDDIGISVAYPLPGTTFYDRVEAELGQVRHWVDSSDLAMLFDGPFPTEFYRALHERVHVEYRLHKARWAAADGRYPGPGQVLRLVRDAVTLPMHKRRVAKLATPSDRALPELSVALDRAAAASPTEQPVTIGKAPARAAERGSDAG